jgi:hypothetical protein
MRFIGLEINEFQCENLGVIHYFQWFKTRFQKQPYDFA